MNVTTPTGIYDPKHHAAHAAHAQRHFSSQGWHWHWHWPCAGRYRPRYLTKTDQCDVTCPDNIIRNRAEPGGADQGTARKGGSNITVRNETSVRCGVWGGWGGEMRPLFWAAAWCACHLIVHDLQMKRWSQLEAIGSMDGAGGSCAAQRSSRSQPRR